MIRIHAENTASSLVEIAHDITGILIRNENLQRCDRLKQNRARLHEALLKRLYCSCLKCHLRGIYRMVRSIVQNCLHADYRISGKRTLRHRFLNSFFYCREIVLRNGSADYFL